MPAHQLLFYLIPKHVATGIYGEIAVTQAQANILREGQDVAIKLLGYQATKVGLLRGHITAISEVPTAQGTLRVRIALPTGLLTTHHQTLPYRPGMQAVAEITVKKLRLVERLFSFTTT